MNEIFKNTCYVCGVISAVSITLCIVKASFGFLFIKRLPPVPMEGLSETEVEIPTLEAVPVSPFPTNNGDAEASLGIGIECGNCRQEIRTAPVAVQGKGSDEKVVYRCEHCGTDVAIPA